MIICSAVFRQTFAKNHSLIIPIFCLPKLSSLKYAPGNEDSDTYLESSPTLR